MLEGKNASGWVLAMVALGLFAVLLVRGLSREESTSPLEQAAASVVMTGNEQSAAHDFSAVFETITARYMPVVVTIYPRSFAEAYPGTFGAKFLREDFPPTIFEAPSKHATSIFPGENKTKVGRHTELDFGCGVLVSSDGHILTNYRLLSMLAPGSSIGDSVVVLLHKKRQAMGRIAGVDPLTDLALIKIEAGGLSYAKLGDSEKLRAGQWVVAIGNSPEQSHTVTAGIVCSKGRSKVVLPHTDDFIQIDAALHAGNAGGALVNLEGELVGITTHFPMPNTGYAIPINLAQRVMQDLIDDGKVTRGFIGMVSQDLDPGLAKALNLDSAIGALVVDVTPGGPADHAGLQRGDVVLQFAGEPVRNAKELPNSIAWQAPGQIVPVVVWRDSVKIVCDVIPKEWPATPMPQTVPSIEHKLTNKLGVHVRRLAPEVARQQDVRGVTVTQIDPGSPVEPMLSPGDIIQEIDRKTVDSVRDFQTVLQQLQSGETVLLLVRRGEKRFFVGVEVI